MTTVATIVCLVLALGVLLVSGLQSVRDHAVARPDLGAAGLLELGVLLYAGTRVASLIGGHHPPSLLLVIVYLIGIILIMPVAAALAIAEQSRWGPLVLCVGAIVVAVLFARIDQIWSGHG